MSEDKKVDMTGREKNMSTEDLFAKLREKAYPPKAQTDTEVSALEHEAMRTFESGATRSSEEDKPDIEGFLSPLVISRYAEYMHEHRTQADGQVRASDNWQKGMPKEEYMKSLLHHVLALWHHHRHTGFYVGENIEEALCAILFNASGYLYELRVKRAQDPAS